MRIKDWKFILLSFGIWRIVLFVVAFISTIIIPKWGGWFPYADTVLTPTGLPSWIWGFGNFDGVHFLMIAQNGYRAFASQAFFPLFPLIIKYFSISFPNNLSLDRQIFVDPSFFSAGFVVANLLFIPALYSFYKLIRIDFSETVARLSVIFLLFYPTSYYFGSVYTESLMLLLVSSSIYFIRKENYLLGGLIAALASLTKVVGVFLVPLIIVEVFIYILRERDNVEKTIKPILAVIAAPLGLIAYCIYLFKSYHNPLLFMTAQPSFGQERSALPVILLPQVIFRYIKIFMSTKILSLNFFNAGLEIVFALGVLTVLIFLIKKMRLSYWIFTLFVLIVPTMTGTFNSMPRYTLMAFLIAPLLIERIDNKYLRVILGVFAILQVVLLSMFIRGYWVS